MSEGLSQNTRTVRAIVVTEGMLPQGADDCVCCNGGSETLLEKAEECIRKFFATQIIVVMPVYSLRLLGLIDHAEQAGFDRTDLSESELSEMFAVQ